MELSEFYPKASKLIESEIAVLNHLRNDPYIKENHSHFALNANQYYTRNRENYLRGFEFVSYFDVYHPPMQKSTGLNKKKGKQGPNTRVFLGARLELEEQSFSNVTYCLAICRIKSARITILRKFHFDVTVAGVKASDGIQEHPRCHLQYCGEMVPEMTKMGCTEAQLEQMHPWLSEPRIFFWPMSLALLIDMALHEFPDQRSKKFRSSKEWRSLVRKQESLVLRPFYQKCVDVIADKNGKNRTLADEFYLV